LVRRGVWEDGEGKKVAAEAGEGSFEILGNVLGPQRDLMVSCWAMKMWMSNGIEWDADMKA
jgi:hypothetical protein